MVVWKQQLAWEDQPYMSLPEDAKILSFGIQGRKPCIWFLTSGACAEWVLRRFRLAGTGHVIDEDQGWEFVGTAQLDEMVFHLFWEDHNHDA